MKQFVIATLIIGMNIIGGVICCAADDDDEDKSVLGGSPPIYAGLPVTGTSQNYRLNRVVPASKTGSSQTLQLGNRCATRIGLFGPGPKLPVGEVCSGIDEHGRSVRGRIVASGLGKFCTTSQGTFGPGLEQLIGVPCQVELKTGQVQGLVSNAD